MDALIKIDTYLDFDQVAEEILCNLYHTQDSSITLIEQSVINEAKNDIRNIIYNCNFNISKVIEYLYEKKLDQGKTQCLASLLENKQQTLLAAALNYYNSSHGEIITNFMWLLKLVFGTSELKTLRHPLLQLTLATVDSKGEQKQNNLDLKKDILMKMINALETACKNTN